MKRFGFLMMLIPLFMASGQLRAEYYNNNNCYADCCDPCDGWGVYADYLYWKTRRCDLDYAINSPLGSILGELHTVDLSYDSGFRVGVTKECNSVYFDVAYTHYRNKESANVSGLLLPTVGEIFTVSSADANWDLDYDVVDLLAGYNLCTTGCFETHVVGGLKLAYVDQKFVTEYVSSINQAVERNTQSIDIDAYGVDLGLGSSLTFCQCLKFFGDCSVDFLWGKIDRKFLTDFRSANASEFTNFVNYKNDCWDLLSVLNLSIGIGYDHIFSNCWCADLGIAIGYEYHQWLGVPGFFGMKSDIISSRNYAPVLPPANAFGFDGLFVRVNLGF